MSEHYNSIGKNSRNRISFFLSVLLAFLSLAGKSYCQVFPNFPTPVNNSSIFVEQGISAASVPNSVFGSVVMSVFVDPSGNDLGWAIASDGQTYSSNGEVFTIPGVDCNASRPSTCAAGVAVFNGVIYIAYADAGDSVLNVITATPVPGGVGYTFNLVHTDTTVALNTSPAMAVTPDGSHLAIIFGTRSNPNVKNAYFEVTLDGSGNWSSASEQFLGSNGIASASQPGLAVLNGHMYMVLQQNGSRDLLFTSTSTDGIQWQPAVEVPSQALKTGASMVTYKGSLVVAVEQDGPTQDLFIFSSPDGVNWTSQEYPSVVMAATPALALFNGGISLTYVPTNFTISGSFTTN